MTGIYVWFAAFMDSVKMMLMKIIKIYKSIE